MIVKVSIIIPCYNYGAYLRETLNCIKNQIYQEWECIIVNDGSSDSTEEISHEFCKSDNRFRYIFQTNKGLSSARNTGLKNASAEFIQLLDADDLISPQKLEKQLQIFEQHPEIDIVVGSAVSFDAQTSRKISCNLPEGMIHEPLDFFIYENPIVVSAPIFRKSVIEKNGYFDEQLTSLEDWDFWLRACYHNLKFFNSQDNSACTSIRQHEGSMKTDQWNMQFNGLKVRKKVQNLLTNKKHIKLNKFYINNYLKTLAYLVFDEIKRNCYEKACQKLDSVNELIPVIRFSFLKWFLKNMPGQYYPRIVLFLFESTKYILKAKLKVQ